MNKIKTLTLYNISKNKKRECLFLSTPKTI